MSVRQRKLEGPHKRVVDKLLAAIRQVSTTDSATVHGDEALEAYRVAVRALKKKQLVDEAIGVEYASVICKLSALARQHSAGGTHAPLSG